MRCLKRNMQKFYYSLYKDKVFIVDEYGNPTCEYEILRSKPIKTKGNISAAKGETDTRQFGETDSYDKVIVMDGNNQIDEYTVPWVDTLPQIDSDGNTTTPYDYVVKKVAKSLNNTTIAISKVQVSV